VATFGANPEFGVCVPSSCSTEEIRQSMLSLSRNIAGDSLATYLFLAGSCTSEVEGPEFDWVDAGFA